MPANPCEECLTRDGVMVVALGAFDARLGWQMEACRRCGHQPIRGALTVGEIRAIVTATPAARENGGDK